MKTVQAAITEINESDEARAARIDAFVRETELDLRDLPRRELSESEPLIAKYRRMGFFD